MENATKALIIAAAVLIAIVLIALGVRLLKAGGDTSAQAEEASKQIDEATTQGVDTLKDALKDFGMIKQTQESPTPTTSGTTPSTSGTTPSTQSTPTIGYSSSNLTGGSRRIIVTVSGGSGDYTVTYQTKTVSGGIYGNVQTVSLSNSQYIINTSQTVHVKIRVVDNQTGNENSRELGPSNNSADM